MDNEGGESVQLIKGEASQPLTLQVLECVPHHATSNQGSEEAQKKRNRFELTPEDKRERKRVADQKSKAKSKGKQEEIKSQRDELATQNESLKQEMFEMLKKQNEKLEREIDQLKLERQQFNSKLEVLHSRNLKLERELREKAEERMNSANETFEAQKQWQRAFALAVERTFLQSTTPPRALDRDNLMERQPYTEQPKLPAEDVPVGHLLAVTDKAHAGSDICQAAGTDPARAVFGHNFQAGTEADAFLAGLSAFTGLSSSPDFSPEHRSNAVSARTP